MTHGMVLTVENLLPETICSSRFCKGKVEDELSRLSVITSSWEDRSISLLMFFKVEISLPGEMLFFTFLLIWVSLLEVRWGWCWMIFPWVLLQHVGYSQGVCWKLCFLGWIPDHYGSRVICWHWSAWVCFHFHLFVFFYSCAVKCVCVCMFVYINANRFSVKTYISGPLRGLNW